MIGKTLGHYRIIEKLGEGGMGVVYKAHDLHLDRFVALKVLPSERVADSERKRRFVQEAKAASALNHPNIIHIYDIDQADGTDFIAMEYVDGKTLDELIPRKGLRLPLALKYAVQVADALARAHDAGIIHRDLKPSNVMVDDHGLVKVLDFGLAKLTEAKGPEDETAATHTGEGTVVGTAAYMSPEQAEGKHIDTRSDIFAFGSLLYEMLTGQQAFRGDTKASTIAAILKEEPKSVSEAAEGLPRELERIVKRCLRKDVDRRFQAMPDLRVALEELKEESDSGALELAAVWKPRPSHRLMWALCAASGLAMAAIGLWFVLSRGKAPEVPLTAVPLTSYPGYESAPSFDPDGKQVAFTWCPEGGANCDIYVKQIGVEAPPSRLTTDPAVDFSPAWSPDGQFIAFLRKLSAASVALMVMPQRGGQEQPLVESAWSDPSRSEHESFLTWTPDSKGLVFTSGNPPPGLFLLDIEAREKRRLTAPPVGSAGDYAPKFSPDGLTLAFTRGAGAVKLGLFLLHLTRDYMPQGVPERVGPDGRFNLDPVWLPDGSEIVFVSGFDGLWRMPVAPSATTPRKLGFASEYACNPVLSRHGNRLAYAVVKQDQNIWRLDLRGSRSLGTPEQFISSTRLDVNPAYSPDGKTIAFVSNRSGTAQIWLCDRNGSGARQLTSIGGSRPKWSPDSRSIAFCGSGNTKLYVVSASGGAPRPLTTGPALDKWPDWSRDGQSIYFVSNRSGHFEIWKMPASGGAAAQLTYGEGGRDLPQESPDGKFIYYESGWPTQCRVWRMPTGGGQAGVILDSVHCEAGWTVWQDGIYFFRPADETGHSDICLYEFATGKTSKILTVERRIDYSIAASPDGRTILWPQFDQSGSDLMLVENFR